MKTAHFPTGDEPVEHDERAALSTSLKGRVFASPARAARETAAWIAPTFEIDSAFIDIDYGRWRGLSLSDLSESEPKNIHAWLTDPDARPHGGESIAMLAKRVGQALDRLATEESDEQCIVVTHAIVVKVALAHVRGEPLANVLRMDISPLSSTELKLSP
ncbi:histidine phosphatase family protein [Caballeronia sp. BR00000012568055]|uniref:histidine phosphatase family protein n=1 Tax=Caballeronia sp. BR00000012568055 TaxID=2918761 RepID=UPI0023F63D4D|nr:histidine phosphatase family protein [Caballeronia sp. BR00000012568055]